MTAAGEGARQVVTAIKAHHAELTERVSSAVGEVLSAARSDGDVAGAVRRLTAVLAGDVVPHARAEEDALYVEAGGDARLLVSAMVDEHHRLLALADELATAGGDATAAAGAARAFRELFEAHVHKENELLLPALAADPRVDLPAVHGRMERAFAEQRGVRS